MTDLIVEADGGSRGNPGIAGSGALVRDSSGRILATRATPLGRASNNVAEYTGLVDGLTLAREIDPSATVEVRMDSKLVVEQMSGRWKIKHEDMKRLAAQAAAILPPTQVTYTWIPRRENGDADALSNEAMDASAAGVQWDPAASRIIVQD
ncbi:reverse transcriptase-like protein [Nesterenkonia lacusekhoensis]|uniref:Phosphoglycerate mutase n=1 Tax=Nesterenkonia lacusekhoensis TaxID=150832 RepID=A0ABS4T0P7_9MICC|nr:putative phosphoglycerate mutase [Nesterenkonia lacusekhoensis]